MPELVDFLVCMLIVIALGIRAGIKEDKESHRGRGW
jgi:hypothetical protein